MLLRKLSIIFLLFFITYCNSKLFQRKDIVDDAKCTIGDIDEANSFLHPLLNKLRVKYKTKKKTQIFLKRKKHFSKFSKLI